MSGHAQIGTQAVPVQMQPAQVTAVQHGTERKQHATEVENQQLRADLGAAKLRNDELEGDLRCACVALSRAAVCRSESQTARGDVHEKAWNFETPELQITTAVNRMKGGQCSKQTALGEAKEPVMGTTLGGIEMQLRGHENAATSLVASQEADGNLKTTVAAELKRCYEAHFVSYVFFCSHQFAVARLSACVELVCS